MTDEHQPDYSDLLRSPYEPDSEVRGEGESDIGWRAPVTAAILGALLVGALVIYAVVTGPDGAEASAGSTTTTVPIVVAPEQSASLPEGFVAVTDNVGFRAEGFQTDPEVLIAVASASVGGIDSALVAPVDIAYWSLGSRDGEALMSDQLGATGALGNHTVSFPLEALPPQAELLAYPAVGEFAVAESLTFEMSDLPIEVVDYPVDLGADRTVVIDRLVIGDGWGHVQWSARGTTAKVDVIVTFLGTDDPGTEDVVDATLLTPSHLRPITPTSGPRSVAPYYNFGMSDQLTRSGQPLSDENRPSGIEVALTITVPESIGDPISIPIPGAS